MRLIAAISSISLLFLPACTPGGGGGSADGGVENPPDGMNGDRMGDSPGPEDETTPPAMMEDPDNPLTGVALSPAELSLNVDGEADLELIGTYADDSTAALEADWASSDAAILTVDAGHVVAKAPGEATITATFGEHMASVVVTVSAGVDPGCAYPAVEPGTVGQGKVMPNVGWPNAYRPDGSTFEFSMLDFHCSADFEQYTSMIVVRGTGWCTTCTAYTQQTLNPMAAQLEAQGALILYVEAQREDSSPADSAYADSHIRRLIGDGPGLRVGSADTQPSPGALVDHLNSFPGIMVVRRSDMVVVADDGNTPDILPVDRVVADLDGDWSDIAEPPFMSNCDPGVEEASEPANDEPAGAAPLNVGDVLTGGICTEAPDYYEITHEGGWQLDLTFSHADGDLDVYVWNAAANEPLIEGGAPVGAESIDDNESFQHSGPALIRIHGYQASSSPYRLSLTEL